MYELTIEERVQRLESQSSVNDKGPFPADPASDQELQLSLLEECYNDDSTSETCDIGHEGTLWILASLRRRGMLKFDATDPNHGLNPPASWGPPLSPDVFRPETVDPHRVVHPDVDEGPKVQRPSIDDLAAYIENPRRDDSPLDTAAYMIEEFDIRLNAYLQTREEQPDA